MASVAASRLRLDDHAIDIPAFHFNRWDSATLVVEVVSCSDLTRFTRQHGEIVVLPENGQDFGIFWSLAADATTHRSIHLQMDIEGKRGGRVVERDGR